MGFCYMLQYMDKLALSQATLFNLTEDLVGRYLTNNAIPYTIGVLVLTHTSPIGPQRHRV